MTSFQPPEPPPSPPSQENPGSPSEQRRWSDELIAVFVAFLSLGSIFFWAISQKDSGFDLTNFLQSPLLSNGVTTSAPSEVLNPSDPTEVRPVAPPAVGPSPAPAATPAPVTPQPPVAIAPAVVPVAPNRPAETATDESKEVAKEAPKPSPTVPNVPVTFPDVPKGYWAAPFIGLLAQKNVITGFENNTFQPNQPITRAEFASMLQKAVDRQKVRDGGRFPDVPAGNWARPAIQETYQSGFLNGYPEGDFRPDRRISRAEALVSAATGLKLQNRTDASQVLKTFRDSPEIPEYAINRIAAAAEAGLVVNYPERDQINPNQALTRADAAALIYQILVNEGKAQPVQSPYITQPSR